MRTYNVYGIKDGGTPEFVRSVASPEEGKAVHAQMKAGGFYNEIRVENVLGDVMFQRKI